VAALQNKEGIRFQVLVQQILGSCHTRWTQIVIPCLVWREITAYNIKKLFTLQELWCSFVTFRTSYYQTIEWHSNNVKKTHMIPFTKKEQKKKGSAFDFFVLNYLLDLSCNTTSFVTEYFKFRWYVYLIYKQ